MGRAAAACCSDATPLAPPLPSQKPRWMTRVHRAINSVFFLPGAVRCGAIEWSLLFIIYRSGLRVDPACHLSAVACVVR